MAHAEVSASGQLLQLLAQQTSRCTAGRERGCLSWRAYRSCLQTRAEVCKVRQPRCFCWEAKPVHLLSCQLPLRQQAASQARLKRIDHAIEHLRRVGLIYVQCGVVSVRRAFWGGGTQFRPCPLRDAKICRRISQFMVILGK